nr:transmembrane protein 18 [Tanacetum cinerariifolium]
MTLAGVYLAKRLNAVLSDNWYSFAGQNCFHRHGVIISVLWSGPLINFTTIILGQKTEATSLGSGCADAKASELTALIKNTTT